MTRRPTVVCLTPIKNEAWILDRFLAAAATWADTIIVADQDSTDDSREIAASHDKVVLVDNTAPAYDEGARQRLLLESARAHVSGPRVLIALDADEALTSDAPGTEEWHRMLAASPGTVLRFKWRNLLPPGDTAWTPRDDIAFGYVDDGSEHGGTRIHSTRLPTPPGAPVLHHDQIAVLHLQFLDWERMKSKQRWYQCWERLNHPDKRPIQVYRQYHRMDALPGEELSAAESSWLQRYEAAGIRFTDIDKLDAYTWDAAVLGWLRDEPDRMRRVDVWDGDWSRRTAALGDSGGAPADPRSAMDKRILDWLRRTQGRADSRTTRWIQRALRPLGW